MTTPGHTCQADPALGSSPGRRPHPAAPRPPFAASTLGESLHTWPWKGNHRTLGTSGEGECPLTDGPAPLRPVRACPSPRVLRLLHVPQRSRSPLSQELFRAASPSCLQLLNGSSIHSTIPGIPRPEPASSLSLGPALPPGARLPDRRAESPRLRHGRPGTTSWETGPRTVSAWGSPTLGNSL